MFNFFKRKAAQQSTETMTAEKLFAAMSPETMGASNALEAKLAQCLTSNEPGLRAELVDKLYHADVWLLTEGEERLGNPAVTQASDGNTYVAIFTSTERAERARDQLPMMKEVTQMPAPELVMSLNASVGIVLNPTEPRLQWSFPPAAAEELRRDFQKLVGDAPGSIFSIPTKEGFRALKVLKADGGGVHIRIYANLWSERPREISAAELSLSVPEGSGLRSYGHLPMSRMSFLKMAPHFVTTAPVADEELEGYRVWEENKGGYF